MNATWIVTLTGLAVVLGLVSSRWGGMRPHPLVLLATILAGLFVVLVCAIPALVHVRGVQDAAFVAGWLSVMAMVNSLAKMCRWGGATSCGGAR